jgi:O-acetyl-ADP-ribose deacetylase (regulator of RNase III)
MEKKTKKQKNANEGQVKKIYPPAIRYVKGDVRKPLGSGNKIIIHCCNDIGVMGAGVAAAISQTWPDVKIEYKQWHRSQKGFKLGNVQYIKVEDDIVVCNMIGQKNIRKKNGLPPIRYSAIRKCLEKVAEAAIMNKASVHAPKFGSALAGGSWDQIEALIEECLIDKGVNVTIYCL